MIEDAQISDPDVRDLLEYLDHISTIGYECDYSYSQTEKFLRSRKLSIQPMLSWLGENSAGRDCEVLFNTAAQC
jgi:hypothetical protein